jgi:putative nucleotidyltransferase with HDIG domain
MKSKIHLFQPKDANDLPASGKIRQQIVSLLKDRESWWGLFFILAILFLFITRTEMSIPNYKAGDIAHSTIRATEDIQIPDTVTTDKKKKEAQDKILPVYDYEPNLMNDSLSRMHEVFTSLRNQEEQAPGGKIGPEKMAEKVKAELNVSIDPEFLSVTARKKFSPQLEESLGLELRKAMSQYIISDRNVLFLYASKGLTVRNQDTGKEEGLSAASVKDVYNIHQMIKTNLENTPGLTRMEVKPSSEFLNTFVAPTIHLNTAETVARRAAAARNVEPVFYQIKKGKVILRDGEEVTPTVMTFLTALRQSSQSGLPIRYSLGIILLLAVYFFALNRYVTTHQHSDIKLRGKALFRLCGIVLLGNMILIKIGLLIASSLSAAYASPPFNIAFAYQVAIPFAAGTLLLSGLTDKEIATVYSFGLAILTGILTQGDFFLAIYCLVSGVVAAFSIRQYYQRIALLKSCFWIWIANLLTVIVIYLIRQAPFDWNHILFFTLGTFLSALLSAAVASVLSPILEWLFDITTDIKLLELSNLDLPILRQLALEAPGTYHHSIVMGTIAEAAAEKVNANPLFVRVSALYHDIGKVRKADYYVENQRDINKHDALNPRMSALVIINHVKEGLEVAKMLRLPSDISGMIPQHHGTRLITYFYKKAKDMENPEIEVVKEEDYRYPGPKPQSKEGAILMLADATEAASRTLTDPTPARLRNMVDTLFRAIFEDGQLDESNLTMKDLNQIADAFVRKLESIFHRRVVYPGYDFNSNEQAKTSGESQNLSEKMAN